MEVRGWADQPNKSKGMVCLKDGVKTQERPPVLVSEFISMKNTLLLMTNFA